MSSFLRRLFRYRATEHRSPLEDFLTECLADLFERLDQKLKAALVRRLFVPEVLLQDWDNLSKEWKTLRMETQYLIPGGRVDMVIFADGAPVIVVENKIAAPIGPGADDGDDQLITYGKWVRRFRTKFPSVVCLLAHVTDPPEGFADGGSKAGGARPHTTRWFLVASVLAELIEPASKASEEVKVLARDFLSFLREEEMSTEFAGREEFAAATIYLRAGTRMDHTFTSIYSHLKELKGFTSTESTHEMSLYFDTPRKLMWGWKFLLHDTLTDLFFGYGIALEPQTVFKEFAAPRQDSVFLCVGADRKKSVQALRSAEALVSKPWTFAEVEGWSAIISFKPLHTFMAEPEAFSLKMIEWVDEVAEDVHSFLLELK